MAPDVVDRQVKAGHLRPVHRGVYVVGPILAPNAMEMAACFACGPAACVSHGSAAALWGILGDRARPALVDIVLAGGNRRRPGIRIHRASTLRSDEVTRLAGIPLTTAARTLLDLAATATARQLERAVAEALVLRRTTAAEIRTLLRRHAGRPGARRLETALGDGSPAFTRSAGEEKFLRLIRKARAPQPRVNVRVGSFEVDFHWPQERLVVEIDGFPFHSSSRAFERDRARDAELTARGLSVMRVTWRQLQSEPEAVLLRLGRALGMSAALRPPTLPAAAGTKGPWP